MDDYHQTVLLHPVGTLLKIKPGCRYLDATLGGGGHSQEIIRLGGRVLALDQDQDAIDRQTAAEVLSPALTSAAGKELICVRSNFNRLLEVAMNYHWLPISGIIFDLGVSFHQLATSSRGFSYKINGPLDMRMDQQLLVSAEKLINSLSKKQLIHMFNQYGDINQTSSWIDLLLESRPITTTNQLSELIPNSIKPQVFQALRIAVNDELNALSQALPQAFEALDNSGRLVVISYHSLEDRIVKNFFSHWVKSDAARLITRKPIRPDRPEVIQNPKSRSAKLRCLEKI